MPTYPDDAAAAEWSRVVEADTPDTVVAHLANVAMAYADAHGISLDHAAHEAAADYIAWDATDTALWRDIAITHHDTDTVIDRMNGLFQQWSEPNNVGFVAQAVLDAAIIDRAGEDDLSRVEVSAAPPGSLADERWAAVFNPGTGPDENPVESRVNAFTQLYYDRREEMETVAAPSRHALIEDLTRTYALFQDPHLLLQDFAYLRKSSVKTDAFPDHRLNDYFEWADTGVEYLRWWVATYYEHELAQRLITTPPAITTDHLLPDQLESIPDMTALNEWSQVDGAASADELSDALSEVVTVYAERYNLAIPAASERASIECMNQWETGSSGHDPTPGAGPEFDPFDLSTAIDSLEGYVVRTPEILDVMQNHWDKCQSEADTAAVFLAGILAVRANDKAGGDAQRHTPEFATEFSGTDEWKQVPTDVETHWTGELKQDSLWEIVTGLYTVADELTEMMDYSFDSAVRETLDTYLDAYSSIEHAALILGVLFAGSDGFFDTYDIGEKTYEAASTTPETWLRALAFQSLYHLLTEEGPGA